MHKNIKSEFLHSMVMHSGADQVDRGRFVVARNVLIWQPVPSTFQWMNILGVDGSK